MLQPCPRCLHNGASPLAEALAVGSSGDSLLPSLAWTRCHYEWEQLTFLSQGGMWPIKETWGTLIALTLFLAARLSPISLAPRFIYYIGISASNVTEFGGCGRPLGLEIKPSLLGFVS